MDHDTQTEALFALSHPGRLAVFRLLARRAPHGVRPSEIANALDLKPNTLSVHVSTLCRAGLLNTWREGRSVYYGVNLSQAGDLVDFLINDCCRGRPEVCESLSAHALKREINRACPAIRYNVLFLCSGNSARSQFAQAILHAEAPNRFCAYSAGMTPHEAVNPHTIAVLKSNGLSVKGLRAKPISEFIGRDAPHFHFIFTVCDQAANEECSRWPGMPMTAHWGVTRPSALCRDETDPLAAFQATFEAIRDRVRRFIALPLNTLDTLSLQSSLDAIGSKRQEGVR